MTKIHFPGCLKPASLRSLNCGRTKMHKNLFAALALNNVCWIVWYTTVPYQPQVLNENPVRTTVIKVSKKLI